MRVKGQFDFVGIQEIRGKKDETKVYHNVALLQGNDVVKVFLSDKTVPLFNEIKKMDAIECELDVNIGTEKSYLGIASVRKMSA